jgi:hypothetical protein
MTHAPAAAVKNTKPAAEKTSDFYRLSNGFPGEGTRSARKRQQTAQNAGYAICQFLCNLFVNFG